MLSPYLLADIVPKLYQQVNITVPGKVRLSGNRTKDAELPDLIALTKAQLSPVGGSRVARAYNLI